MAKTCATLWEREHIDDVPEYGVAIIYDGEHFRRLKYVPERTCRDVSDDEDRFVCSECGAKMDWDTCEWDCVIGGFCFACGARIDN